MTDNMPFDARAYLVEQGLQEGEVYRFQQRGESAGIVFNARIQIQSLIGSGQKIVLEHEDGTTSTVANLNSFKVQVVTPEIRTQVLTVFADKETARTEDPGY